MVVKFVVHTRKKLKEGKEKAVRKSRHSVRDLFLTPFPLMMTSSLSSAEDQEEHLLANTQPPTREQARGSTLFGYALILVTAMLYTAQTVVQDYTLKQIKVAVFSYLFWRGVINTVLSILYVIGVKDTRSKVMRMNKKELILLAKLAVAIACIAMSYALGLKYSISGNSASLNESSPIFLYTYSYFFCHIALSPTDITSLLLNVTGVVLIVQSSDGVVTSLIGSLFAFFSALFGAIFMTLSKEAAKTMSFIFPAVSGEVLLIFVGFAFSDQKETFAMLFNPSQLVLVTIVGLCVFIGHCIVTVGLKHCRPDRASLILMMNIPASYMLGYLLLDEKLKVMAVIGSACIIVGGGMICFASQGENLVHGIGPEDKC